MRGVWARAGVVGLLAAGPLACTRVNPGFLDTDLGGTTSAASDGTSVDGGDGDSGSTETSASTDSGSAGDGDGDGDGDGVESLPFCDRLDLVFVLDGDDTSGLVQAEMAQQMQYFVDQVLPNDALHPWAQDFHIGVVRAQAHSNQGPCTDVGLHDPAAGMLGCNLVGSPFVSPDTPDPAGVLACMFQPVPTLGGDGPPPLALASARALGATIPGDTIDQAVVDQCNDGFARPGSIKVVVPISARDDAVADQGSPGGPFDWAQWMQPFQNNVWSADGSDLIMHATVPLDFTCGELAANVLSWTSMLDHDVPLDFCAIPPLDWVREIDEKLHVVCQP